MEFQNFLKTEEVNPSDLTPIMKQYYDFKIEYKDFILLFQVGSFFETYFDDAVIFSKICGLTVTKRKFKTGNVLMAGIPVSELEIYVNKLIKNNLKVVVVSQMGKKDENGFMERKVTKTYTGGCLFDIEFLNPKENNYLASVYKCGDIYQICYSDISTGEIYFSSGDSDEIRCELGRISPVELLIPSGNEIEKELYEAYNFELSDERFFKGEYENFAVNGVINYAKYILKDLMIEFEELKKYDIKKILMMDFLTRKNLELTYNSYNKSEKGTILKSLDNCKTPMGKRLLSSIISTPLSDLKEIQKRQNTLKKFLENDKITEKLSFLLTGLGDISRLKSRMSNKTITPLEFLTLKEGLKILSEIEKIRDEFDSEILNSSLEETEILIDFSDILERVFEDDAEMVKSGKFIKKGANSELDILFNEYENLKKEIKDYEKALQIYTNINALKIVKSKGAFFIEIPNGSVNPLGADFRVIQKLKAITKYTTDKLLVLEEKIFSTSSKIEETKKSVFENLKKYAKEIAPYVGKYSKVLALSDVFQSFYFSVREDNLVCPLIKENGKIKIEKGRHIAAEKILFGFEPLDFEFEKQLTILTGRNGIGKSTLLKEIATNIILAQAGCFVPCSYAEFPLFCKLFSVLNVSDDLINKKSVHQAQMREVSRITRLMDDKSIILLDEIGKNTSYKEGISILYGLMRYFLEDGKAKIISSTHFLYIKELLNGFEDKISYVKMTECNEKREISSGISEKSKGIEAAKEENLPEKVINYANEALDIIQLA